MCVSEEDVSATPKLETSEKKSFKPIPFYLFPFILYLEVFRQKVLSSFLLFFFLRRNSLITLFFSLFHWLILWFSGTNAVY